MYSILGLVKKPKNPFLFPLQCGMFHVRENWVDLVSEATQVKHALCQ